MVEVVENLTGGATRRPIQHSVLKEAPRDFQNQFQSEDVVGPDTLDLLQVHNRGFQNALKRFELFHGFFGRHLAIAPGSAQGQEEFDDLIIQEAHQSAAEKFLSQSPAVPGAGRKALGRSAPDIIHLNP